MFRILQAVALTAVLSTPALADIRVDFDEGAPVDRFTIRNTGACPLGPATVTIDLSGSAGGLIFDVTGAGAGIQVFQPFRVVVGEALLTGLPEVSDGDTSIVLPLRGLESGAQVAFTIDVDDTVSSYGTMIAGSEIEGATLRIDTGNGAMEGAFGRDSRAAVAVASCVS